ncbi:probable V-type proton ATPase subunit a, vacuolar isoform [Saccharomycodes ludwigii]|uniref:V-type proton ATPase subunit a n=1 Tax=Saccharomycodes ludwigii TaxID=36035 RepID=A0A376B102_9ASCO|nr:probable V-type proton ATPase subunit a, vacuolar isoform [Saccharomycodes ludwigii]
MTSVVNEKDEAIFRSAEMSLFQLFIPAENARETAYQLGASKLVQFRDLNRKIRTFQRHFVDEIRKLDNTQRQYNYFAKLLEKYNIPISNTSYYLNDEDDEESSEGGRLRLIKNLRIPTTGEIDEYSNNATLLEQRLTEMVDALNSLESSKVDLEQFRHVLNAGDIFFDGDNRKKARTTSIVSQPDSIIMDGNNVSENANISFVTGLIPRDKIGTLEQILWRVLRGNLFFYHLEIETPIYDSKLNKEVAKNCFIVFSHGDLIINRIKKISESLDAQLYDISSDSVSRTKQLHNCNVRLQDLYTVLETTRTTLESELYAIGKELNSWAFDVSRDKQVYSIMNLWEYDSANRKTLTAEGWIPTDELNYLQAVLNGGDEGGATFGSANSGISESSSNNNDIPPCIINVVSTTRTPPTFHRTNKFTQGFQDICDCYGIAQYREINAGLPTIVTFPFMFAIMFGDMGHGLLMFLAASVLVLNEKKIGRMKRDEIFDMAYSGRYILLMMGLFSIYTGFLYNDMFSKSLTLFKSGWKWPSDFKLGETIMAKQVGVYSFGLDYAWHGTENGLLFSNSYKMKLSILMGFIHMSYSYMFSLANHLFFGSVIDIIGNFIPGLIFMQGIFGYLSVCIVYKWAKDWIKDSKPAPGLLNMLINMFLSPGVIDDELYPHQAKVQVVLLLLALICIPWLLLVKPLHFKFTHGNKKHELLPQSETADVENQHVAVVHGEDSNDDNEEIDDDDDDETPHEENFGDLMIHQVIHTIEFCLNCVSHTASYLRLWALSLAHAQLSEVLWTMTIQIAFNMSGVIGVIMTVCLFALWFVLTCAVLVVMEGTSAMLHSLRLHWVESMSKFFVGEGILYEPFKFEFQELL